MESVLFYRFRYADGSWHWFESRTTPYVTSRGETREVVLSFDEADEEGGAVVAEGDSSEEDDLGEEDDLEETELAIAELRRRLPAGSARYRRQGLQRRVESAAPGSELCR